MNNSLNRVLVIDDDNAMTDLLRLSLETESFNVVISNSGQGGISAAQKSEPDVILLDMMMPDIDGWEICKSIREFSPVPIIVLSALNTPGMVSRALDAGADEFLVKPVPMGTLIAHLKRMTRRSRAEKNATPGEHYR